jgi:Tol biopolymer transport system component
MPSWAVARAANQDGVADPSGRIVFGSITRYEPFGQVLGTLYAIDPDGTSFSRITSCDIERPRISPDGSRVAFSIVMSDGSWQIATLNMDGTDLRVLTATRGYAQWPDWMPDGRSIVYANAPEPCDAEPDCLNVRYTLWQMDSDGANQRQIGDPLAFDSEPRISPDGAEIVFDRYDAAADRNAFMIRTIASGAERRVTTTNVTDITHPDWTRDGRSIVYNTNGDGSNGIGQQIELVPADDPVRAPHSLYGDLQHDAFKPAFSPDGSRIVFGCGLPICLMNADGSNVVVLVEAPGVELNHPAWGVNADAG